MAAKSEQESLKPVGRKKGSKAVKARKSEVRRRLGRPPFWTDERIDDVAEKLMDWAADPRSLFLEGFCAGRRDYLLYPQKMSELASKSPSFAEALKYAKSCCVKNLSDAIASERVPTAYGIFALKNVGGWRDRQEVEQRHTGYIAHAHEHTIRLDTTGLGDLLGPTSGGAGPAGSPVSGELAPPWEDAEIIEEGGSGAAGSVPAGSEPASPSTPEPKGPENG